MGFASAVSRLHSCCRVATWVTGVSGGPLPTSATAWTRGFAIPDSLLLESDPWSCCEHCTPAASSTRNQAQLPVILMLCPLSRTRSPWVWNTLEIKVTMRKWLGGLGVKDPRVLHIPSVAKLVRAILWKITGIDGRFRSLLFTEFYAEWRSFYLIAVCLLSLKYINFAFVFS